MIRGIKSLHKDKNFSISSENTDICLKVALLALAVSFAYSRVAPLLWSAWNEGDYSHGMLVPFVSIYLIWIDRNKLTKVEIRPKTLIGFSIMFVSSLMLIVGEIGSINAIQLYSILLLIPGLIIFFFGFPYLKVLSLPVAYLIFMVPFLDPVMERIHWPLQISTSVMVSLFLNLIQIPMMRSGQYIELPNATLEVAEECSGLQFLIATVAIGIPLAHLTQRLLWKKIVLIASSVVVGLISNWLRVIVIALWTYYTGQFSHGPIHTFKGMLVAVIGFVILFAEARVLSRNSSPNADHKDNLSDVSPKIISLYKFKGLWIVTALFLFIGAFLILYIPAPVPLNRPLNKLSFSHSGDWKGKETGRQSTPLTLPGADSEITLAFEGKAGHNVNLYIGYFESQIQGKELINDNLKKLQSGLSKVRVDIVNNEPFYVNRKVINNGNERHLLLFWYNVNGHKISDKYSVKLYTILNGLLHGRTNGALIMVYSPLSDTDEIYAVEATQKAFIQDFNSGIFNSLKQG